MVLATGTLLATLGVAARASRVQTGPGRSCGAPARAAEPDGRYRLVMRDRYLLLIALLVVLLNWINSTGEFILAISCSAMPSRAWRRAAACSTAGALITAFYGNFHYWVTLVGLAIQLLLVARIYRHVGVRGALLIHPAIVAIGYGLMTLAPLLAASCRSSR